MEWDLDLGLRSGYRRDLGIYFIGIIFFVTSLCICLLGLG